MGYNKAIHSGDRRFVKLDRQLNRHFQKRTTLNFNLKAIRHAEFRAFSGRWVYFDEFLNAYHSRLHGFFLDEEYNPTIAYDGMAADYSFTALSVGGLFDKGLTKTGNGRAQGVARYRYTKSGERVDNITDWGLNKFVAHYGKKAGITKDAIFHYVYAVMHDPVYRDKYALNLKREFPRIPFYPDFVKWAAWGETLMAMHIGYEDVEPWAVERVDTPNARRAEGTHPKPILKSLPEQGLVRVDEDTQITGIPREAWDYRLGNRSAIDWVLDQHKEKTPRDPTIREKFNTYRFADYKERMIDLLAKVVRVSVGTVAITEAMKALDRSGWDEGAETK